MAYALLDSSSLSWTGQPRLLHLAVTATNGEIKSASININALSNLVELLEAIVFSTSHSVGLIITNSVGMVVYMCRYESLRFETQNAARNDMQQSRTVGRNAARESDTLSERRIPSELIP